MPAPEPFLVRHAALVFALKTFAAACIALLLALWMDLPRPYWAMATVYITSQPLSGATRSKAAYRVGGTLIGAIAAVALVPNFVDAPELLSLAIALWVGVCLYISLLDRTPRSYLFMLSGYTAALIGFPAVAEPGNIFDIALARVEEISLGIVCASMVSTVLLPRAVGPAVAGRIERWLQDARLLTHEVLADRKSDRALRERRLRLAADAVEIDLLASHLSYDRSMQSASSHWLYAIWQRMLVLLPVVSSVSDRLVALSPARLRQIKPLVDDIERWLADGDAGREPADRLRNAIAAQEPQLGAWASWDDILLASLLERLRELVDVSHDCRLLMHHIAAGGGPLDEALAFHPDAGVAAARHRDHGMALWSAAGAILAILICCAFWIGTGWTDGASAPMMAAVACSFFAAQDDPAPGIRGFGIWSLVSMVIVGTYLFAVLPMITDIELLIAVLAPTFVVVGLLIARPRTSTIGMALGANTATLLALQSTYSADFAAFVNSCIAFIVGMSFAVILTRLARSVGAEWSVRRLVRTAWKSLAVAAERRGQHDRARFAGLMLSRIGLLAPRLAALPPGSLRDADYLRELRTGLNIVDLRRARHGLTPPALAAMDAMLDDLAGQFRRRHTDALSPRLLDKIDAALAAALQGAEGQTRRDALIGLVGIRRGLFPDAQPYLPAAPVPHGGPEMAA